MTLLERLGLMTVVDGIPMFRSPAYCRCGAVLGMEFSLNAPGLHTRGEMLERGAFAVTQTGHPWSAYHAGTPCDWFLAELSKP